LVFLLVRLGTYTAAGALALFAQLRLPFSFNFTSLHGRSHNMKRFSASNTSLATSLTGLTVSLVICTSTAIADKPNPPVALPPVTVPDIQAPIAPVKQLPPDFPAEMPTAGDWRQMRNEILQIRQRLGINPLAGTSLDDKPGEQPAAGSNFANTLDKVAGEDKQPSPTGRRQPLPQITPLLPNALPPIRAAGHNAALPALNSNPAAASYRDTLLSTARLLDRKADFLEDADNLPGARKIRRLAKQLRKEAGE